MRNGEIMKTRYVLIVLQLLLVVSVYASSDKRKNAEETIIDKVNDLVNRAESPSEFEISYHAYSNRAVALKSSDKTMRQLMFSKLMFYYYRHRLDTMEHYVPILHEAFRKAGDVSNCYFVQATMADAYTTNGDIGKSLRVGRSMMKEASAHHEDYGLALGAYSLAITYFTMNFHEKAIPYFEQALPILYKSNDKDTYAVATCNYLSSLTEKHQYRKAQRVFSRLDALIDSSENAKKPFISRYVVPNVKGTIGTQLYLFLKQPRMVKKYLDETEAYYRRHKDITRKSPLFESRLKYAIITHNYSQQLVCADSLERLFKDNLASGYRMFKVKADAYEGMGNYHKSLQLLKAYYDIKDSISSEEVSNRVNQFAAEYDYDRLKMEKTELALQLKNKQARFLLVTVVISFLLLLTIIIFAAYLLKMNRRQKKMIAMKDDFIRNVSHEIRTPLNYIVGFSDVIAQTANDEDTLGMMEKIHLGSEQLLKMFDDMIILSDNESGGRKVQNETFDVTELCKAVVAECQGLVNDATHMVYDGAEVPLVISADKLKLRYVLYNLLHNAAKFTSEGVITVHADKVDSHCVIRVKDTGKGIKPESRSHLFTSFFKEDVFTQGLGLGLVNARTEVEKMGGTLTLNHLYTGGAEFIIRIG